MGRGHQKPLSLPHSKNKQTRERERERDFLRRGVPFLHLGDGDGDGGDLVTHHLFLRSRLRPTFSATTVTVRVQRTRWMCFFFLLFREPCSAYGTHQVGHISLSSSSIVVAFLPLTPLGAPENREKKSRRKVRLIDTPVRFFFAICAEQSSPLPPPPNEFHLFTQNMRCKV